MLGVHPDVVLPHEAIRVADGGLEGGFDVLGRGEDALEGGEFADGARVGGEGYDCRGVVGDGVDVGGGGEGTGWGCVLVGGAMGGGEGRVVDGLCGFGDCLVGGEGGVGECVGCVWDGEEEVRRWVD